MEFNLYLSKITNDDVTDIRGHLCVDSTVCYFCERLNTVRTSDFLKK